MHLARVTPSRILTDAVIVAAPGPLELVLYVWPRTGCAVWLLAGRRLRVVEWGLA